MQILRGHVWQDILKTTKQQLYIEHTYALILNIMDKSRQNNVTTICQYIYADIFRIHLARQDKNNKTINLSMSIQTH